MCFKHLFRKFWWRPNFDETWYQIFLTEWWSLFFSCMLWKNFSAITFLVFPETLRKIFYLLLQQKKPKTGTWAIDKLIHIVKQHSICMRESDCCLEVSNYLISRNFSAVVLNGMFCCHSCISLPALCDAITVIGLFFR